MTIDDQWRIVDAMRRLIIFALILATGSVPLAAAAHADGGTTYTWVGSSQNPNADNHSWTDARNWSPSGVPGDGDSAFIAPPDMTHCTAAVDSIPTVALVNLSVTQPHDMCGTSVTGGPITVTGTFDWDGGALHTALTMAAGSSGTVSATNGIQNAVWQDIEVDGSLTLDNVSGTGALFFANYSNLQITVGPGGTLHSSGATAMSALSCCNAPASIVNNGTVRIDSGQLHAAGIEIDQHGTLFAAAGATLDSDGGLVNTTDGAHYNGAGTWTIENGSKARLLGRQTLGTPFHLQLGTVGALSGAVMGGAFTVGGTGTFDWSAGTLGGAVTIAPTARLHLSGVTINNGRRQLAPTDPTSSSTHPSKLTNHGTTTVDNGAAFSVAGATTVANATDGTLNLAPGTTINGTACCVAPPVLSNAGLLDVGTAASSSPVVFSSLSYQDDLGTTSIAPGQELQLPHGPRHTLTGTNLAGGGTLQLGGATTVTGHLKLTDGTAVALVSGGTMDGTSTLDGAGSMQWTGGSMSGNLTIGPSGGVSVSGTAAKSVANNLAGNPSTVRVATALRFAAGTTSAHDFLGLGSSTLITSKQTTVPAFVEINSGNLRNTGTFTVSAGSAAHADRSGPTETTVNTGTIGITSGTFALANTYEQDAGQLSITATSRGNGLLTATHTASVAGTVHIVNRAFYPAVICETRTVLTSAGLTWTGTVTTGGTDSTEGQWVAAPTATALAVEWQPDASPPCP